ncbi:MAG: T9SS type A sorting domain-containing protein [Bacteroidales bacterium]|jgi:hypothetical protein|nr:T9SS type A sorting domain-containing protein [Bacteroidales bacterium]
MKKSLFLLALALGALYAPAQKDTVISATKLQQSRFVRETPSVNINIYPVPVKTDSFTIRTDKAITQVKVTNMIGQDIYRAQYKNPLQITKIMLDNPRRGIYLVTVVFSDGLRVVKKIMVEENQ